MPHHVYANDNEICSKSADGTSDLAPDVCFSPGAPMPGVPVPYMNSCKAGDITNGSKTVFIKGMEVCLEDKSYFSTSYGDEPATKGLKKGTVSTSVQGKCRFINWSPNVFVEGLAVTRHLDLVTHNHNSPANTPPAHYMSLATPSGVCAKDLAKINKHCQPGPDQTEEEKKKNKGRKKKASGIVDKIKDATHALDELGEKSALYKRKPGGTATSGNAWMDHHCGGMWIKPTDGFDADLEGKLKETLAGLEKQKSALIEGLGKELEDLAKEAAPELAKSIATRNGSCPGCDDRLADRRCDIGCLGACQYCRARGRGDQRRDIGSQRPGQESRRDSE
jgi:Domain of unknown function (DUF4150)